MNRHGQIKRNRSKRAEVESHDQGLEGAHSKLRNSVFVLYGKRVPLERSAAAFSSLCDAGTRPHSARPMTTRMAGMTRADAGDAGGLSNVTDRHASATA